MKRSGDALTIQDASTTFYALAGSDIPVIHRVGQPNTMVSGLTLTIDVIDEGGRSSWSQQRHLMVEPQRLTDKASVWPGPDPWPKPAAADSC